MSCVYVRACMAGLAAGIGIIAWTAAANAEPAFKTIYRFKGGPHDGASPMSPLVVDKDGALYGVTYKGGAKDWGTVFMLSPPTPPDTIWKKTILHHFQCGPTDGCGPMAGLILHRGRLYGTAFYGGTLGGGAVFRLSPPPSGSTAWKYELLYNFKDVPDGYSPHTNVVIDDDGAVYGFTYGGGSGTGTLYKLTPARKAPWPETLLHNFTGMPDGSPLVTGNAGRPIWHPNGAITTTSWAGGAGGAGTVFQFMPGATQPEILYSFPSGGLPMQGVVADATGVLFGTTTFGGAHGSGSVFKLTPPTPPSATWSFSTIHDLPAAVGHNSADPSGVIMNAHGRLFGSAQYGGTRNAGYVYRLSPPAAGPGPWTRTVLYNFRGGGDGARPATLLLGRGVLYGTTYAGGTACNCGTVFMIEP